MTQRSRHRSLGGQDRGPAQGSFFFSGLSNLHNRCPHIRSFSGDRASSQDPTFPFAAARILDARQVFSSPTRRHQEKLGTYSTASRPERERQLSLYTGKPLNFSVNRWSKLDNPLSESRWVQVNPCTSIVLEHQLAFSEEFVITVSSISATVS